MRLEHYPIERLRNEILEIFGKYLDLEKYRLFFFGSRVTDKGDEHSDIDVGIEGQEEISYEAMAEIQEEIGSLPTLYKIEIVDFKKVSLDFREVALKHTEPIA